MEEKASTVEAKKIEKLEEKAPIVEAKKEEKVEEVAKKEGMKKEKTSVASSNMITKPFNNAKAKGHTRGLIAEHGYIKCPSKSKLARSSAFLVTVG